MTMRLFIVFIHNSKINMFDYYTNINMHLYEKLVTNQSYEYHNN